MTRENSPEMSVGPIRPEEVVELKKQQIPSEVFETINRLIGERIVGGEVTIKQDDIVEELVIKGLQSAEIFRRGWLNVEPAYQDAGWKVAYDKPGYNETYPATFKFSNRKK